MKKLSKEMVLKSIYSSIPAAIAIGVLVYLFNGSYYSPICWKLMDDIGYYEGEISVETTIRYAKLSYCDACKIVAGITHSVVNDYGNARDEE